MYNRIYLIYITKITLNMIFFHTSHKSLTKYNYLKMCVFIKVLY